MAYKKRDYGELINNEVINSELIEINKEINCSQSKKPNLQQKSNNYEQAAEHFLFSPQDSVKFNFGNRMQSNFDLNDKEINLIDNNGFCSNSNQNTVASDRKNVSENYFSNQEYENDVLNHFSQFTDKDITPNSLASSEINFESNDKRVKKTRDQTDDDILNNFIIRLSQINDKEAKNTPEINKNDYGYREAQLFEEIRNKTLENSQNSTMIRDANVNQSVQHDNYVLDKFLSELNEENIEKSNEEINEEESNRKVLEQTINDLRRKNIQEPPRAITPIIINNNDNYDQNSLINEQEGTETTFSEVFSLIHNENNFEFDYDYYRQNKNQNVFDKTCQVLHNWERDIERNIEETIMDAGSSYQSAKNFIVTLKTFNNSKTAPEPSDNIEENNSQEESQNSLITDSPDEKLAKGIASICTKKGLVYSGPLVKNDIRKIMEEAKVKIKYIFKHLCQSTEYKNGLCLLLRSKYANDNIVFQCNRLQYNNPDKVVYSTLNGTRKASKNTFQRTLFVLAKIFALISTNKSCNQRELYYQNVYTLQKMSYLSDAVNKASNLLGVAPWYLGITSTNKGLIYGKLTIMFSSDQIIECNAPQGTLIPSNLDNIQLVESSAAFILIVEKDAIFQKLLEEDIPNKLAKPFLLITGKGYPDLSTRRILVKLWQMLKIPAFILVDADPHGIEIMLTYRFGSREWAHLSEELALPSLRWLGVLPSEILLYNLRAQKLTEIDTRKIHHILNRPYMKNVGKIKEELEILLKNGRKAEIEGVMKSDCFLTDVYLPNKLYSHDFI